MLAKRAEAEKVATDQHGALPSDALMDAVHGATIQHFQSPYNRENLKLPQMDSSALVALSLLLKCLSSIPSSA